MAFQIIRKSYFRFFLAGSINLSYITALFLSNQSDTSFLRFRHFKERNYPTDTGLLFKKDFSYFFTDSKEKHKTMIKILLLIDYSSEFDRKLLRGLVQYSRENGPWLFYRLPSYYKVMYGEQGILKWAKEWKANAIIGQWNNDTIDLQKELNIPVVLQNYYHRSVTCSNLTGDYKGTGRMAAQFFSKKMFWNFAYFGVKGVVWSDERCEGYRQEVKRIGGNFFSFESPQQKDEIRTEVNQWLQKLPKPVALFCCDDTHALFISETCQMTNISIPEEIALLGVDNDELMCNISDPPISSIELEVEKGGYSIGRLIHQQIKKEHKDTFNIVISPIRIKLRQSTEKYNIKNPYIQEVVKYIETHYSSDLTVKSLLANIPLSRRNFEVKFKNELNTSIYQYILNCRCNHLADLLLTTDRPLADLAIEVGFKDYNNISRVFKKLKGCSPLEYRLKKSNRS